MTGTPPRSPGRPKTGQKPVKSFRPPEALWEEVEKIADAEGRKHSDLVIEALHDLVKKKRRDKGAGPDG
jgi:hypothetical protein